MFSISFHNISIRTFSYAFSRTINATCVCGGGGGDAEGKHLTGVKHTMAKKQYEFDKMFRINKIWHRQIKGDSKKIIWDMHKWGVKPRKMADVQRKTHTQERLQTEPNNYTEIAVICIIGRIHFEVLKNVIEKEIDTKPVEEQSGLGAGRSTINDIFTLKIIIGKRIQRCRETHVDKCDYNEFTDVATLSDMNTVSART
jgi:hypothetical protein